MARTSLALMRDKFHIQRCRAKKRGIDFLLTFKEWFAIWKRSRRYPMRGNLAGQFCMARKGDRGPYAVGNVSIVSNERNKREAGPLVSMSKSGRPMPPRSASHRAAIVKARTGKRWTKAQRKRMSETWHERRTPTPRKQVDG